MYRVPQALLNVGKCKRATEKKKTHPIYLSLYSCLDLTELCEFLIVLESFLKHIEVHLYLQGSLGATFKQRRMAVGHWYYLKIFLFSNIHLKEEVYSLIQLNSPGIATQEKGLKAPIHFNLSICLQSVLVCSTKQTEVFLYMNKLFELSIFENTHLVLRPD